MKISFALKFIKNVSLFFPPHKLWVLKNILKKTDKDFIFTYITT